MSDNIKISNVPCPDIDVKNGLWTTDNNIVINNVPSQEVGVGNNPTVLSVNGYAGTVNLTHDDIPSGKEFTKYSKDEKEKLANIDESLVGVTLDNFAEKVDLESAVQDAIKDLKDNGELTSFTTDETLSFNGGVLSVNTAKSAEADNTLPITAAAVYTQIGNIEVLLETI